VFDLDLKSRKPIYEQLMEQIKMMIFQKVVEKDEQLPSVRSLAQELTINPNTIQKAYRELERDNFIYSVPGKGSFVNDMNDSINKERINLLTKDLERIMRELLYLNISTDDLKHLVDKAAKQLNGTDNQSSPVNERGGELMKLEAKNTDKSFGRKKAVNDVSLVVEPGNHPRPTRIKRCRKDDFYESLIRDLQSRPGECGV
jgi:GntR family transcriptional regulator